MRVRQKLDWLDAHGLIYWPKKEGGVPQYKRYLSLYKGAKIQSVWTDIAPLQGSSKEYVGYPTQKPLKLYDRFIRIASNPGEIVFDPFCGCATTLVAAEMSKREWLGCDIWDRANEQVLVRLYREGLNPGSPERKLSNEDLAKHMKVNEQLAFWFNKYDVNYTDTLPKRTDDGAIAAPYLRTPLKAMSAPPADEDASAGWPKEQKKEYLIDATGGMYCWGCGDDFRHPDYLHLDHIRPRADGGSNNVSNLALLCPPCNGAKRKGANLTLSGLRAKNKRDKFMVREIDIPRIPPIHE